MTDAPDLHIPVALEIDVGPAVQDELAAAGLVPQRQAPSADAPSPAAPRSPEDDADLAQTLAAAERLTPRQQSSVDEATTTASAAPGDSAAPPDPTTEPYFVGFFEPGMPIYGCPGCGFRERSPESVMWHLRSHPIHDRGGKS